MPRTTFVCAQTATFIIHSFPREHNTEAFVDENGQAIYSVFVYADGFIEEIYTSEDFATVREQSFSTGTTTGSDFVVELYWNFGGQDYLIKREVFSSR